MTWDDPSFSNLSCPSIAQDTIQFEIKLQKMIKSSMHLIFLTFSALYGVLFGEDCQAGFSNYRLWESIGFIVMFATNSTLCTITRLYITLGFLLFGMTFYYILEFYISRKNEPNN